MSDAVSRRAFMALSAALMAAPAAATPAIRGGQARPNVLFLLTDQERYFPSFPVPLPGRARLQRMGVTFEQHQIAANVCSPSRSVIYTGQHIQHTGVYDNVNAPWQRSMSRKVPTIGTLLREAGYFTAYKGKFHLAAELEHANDPEAPTELLTEVLEAYGFSDYLGVGDIIAATHGGYFHDEVIAAMSVHWLRSRARQLADDGKPWFLAVNLINPHDAMYVDTDLPGEPVQGANRPIMDIAPPPNTPLYRASWEVPLPTSRHQPFDAPGRPSAHWDFQDGRSVLVGNWPDEDRRWRVLQDYYFNCLRDSDRHIERIVSELEQQGLLENTVIVATSDHGELGGAHQMHGKGPCAYREQNHVPLIVVHPDVPGGQRCGALTSHVDLVPTLLDLAGAPDPSLVGRSLLPLLESPSEAGIHALREHTLFNFNMLGFLDAAFMRQLKSVRDAKGLGKVSQGGRIVGAVKRALRKRGAIRSLYDGRTRFSRYFSPREHHRPESWEQLVALNDLELFDLETDPHELRNLALEPAHRALVESLNARLNHCIAHEVGEDHGKSVPLARLAKWEISGVNL